MLALPILLMLLYGMLEVGRLIFILSATANASRQAARYGSGSGDISGDSNDVSFYQDCDGIRKVANESAFITTFDQINITYDRGLYPDGNQIPITGINPDPSVDSCPIGKDTIRNGDRIIVQVRTKYEPIISFIPIQPLEIVSASARSFLVSIPIFGSAFPTGFAAESSTPSVTPTVLTMTYTPTIERTSTSTSTNTPRSGSLYTPPVYVTPVNTLTPTITFTPSSTSLPTITPSITPTNIPCSGVTGVFHGPLTINDNVMEMSINNQTGYTLLTAQVYLEWNHDTGHGNSNDRGLRLRQITLAEDAWSGDLKSPSVYIEGYYPLIPPGESKIQFVFDQNYNVPDGTERIIIYIGTPGCINYPVDSRN